MKGTLVLFFIKLTPFLLIAQENHPSGEIDHEYAIKPYRIGIVVTDLDKSTAWYETVFDVRLYQKFSYPEYDSMRVHLLKSDHVQFELVSRKKYYHPEEVFKDYDYREKPMIGFYKLTYEINDIEDFYENLKKKGIEIFFELGTDEDLKIKAFHIKDPDGNVLQFVEELE